MATSIAQLTATIKQLSEEENPGLVQAHVEPNKENKVEPVAQEKLAHITPHHLAALSLCRAAEALERVASDRTTWFFIILDLHRALHWH